MAHTYTLTYFDGRGRAEAIRMVFHHAGQEFEDKRLSFPEFGEIKGNPEECPSGFLPMITAGGKKASETAALLRFVGNEFNLGGEDNIEKFLIDSIIVTLKEVHDTAVIIRFLTGDEAKEAQKVKVDEIIKKHFKCLEYRVKENSGNDFLVGSKISVADIYLVDVFDVVTEQANVKIFDDFPLVKNVNEKTRESPNLKKYLATRK